MFCLNTALGGGIVAPPWRCSDSWEAKFSGQTSHGTMKVTQILALSGHSIAPGLPMLTPFFSQKFFQLLKRQFGFTLQSLWEALPASTGRQNNSL